MFSRTERGAACAQAVASRAERASPQNRLSRNEGKAPGSKRRSFDANMATDGTENQTVNSFSLIRLAGTRYCSGNGQRVAPASQQTNRSCTLRSNVRSKFCEQRSSGLRAYRAPA